MKHSQFYKTLVEDNMLVYFYKYASVHHGIRQILSQAFTWKDTDHEQYWGRLGSASSNKLNSYDISTLKTKHPELFI